MIVMLGMLSSIWLMSDMLRKYMKSSMERNGQDSTLKKYVKFVMQESKELHNCSVIFDFQTLCKETIDIDHLFI